uniref:Uncharacterized protein n=1 Tax=Glossina austeni TaxID=7395 RepID=A0A1A9UZE9_GLOAU
MWNCAEVTDDKSLAKEERVSKVIGNIEITTAFSGKPEFLAANERFLSSQGPNVVLLHKLSCVTLEFLYSVCFTRNIFYTLFDVLKLPMDVKPMHSLMHAYICTFGYGRPYFKSKNINIHALGNTESDTRRHTFSCSLNEHFRCLSSGGHGNRNCELFEIYKCNLALVLAICYQSQTNANNKNKLKVDLIPSHELLKLKKLRRKGKRGHWGSELFLVKEDITSKVSIKENREYLQRKFTLLSGTKLCAVAHRSLPNHNNSGDRIDRLP